MSEHRPTVAEVFRQHEQAFLERWGHTLSDRQLQTLRDLGACRTAALGAHLHQCADCQREVIVYNSCFMGSLSLWGLKHRNSHKAGPFRPSSATTTHHKGEG